MGDGGWKYEDHFEDYDRIGDLGVYMGMIPLFQDWWFAYREGGFEQCFVDFMSETIYMEEIYEFWTAWALEMLKAMIKANPDLIELGGSSTSLSVSSPTIFRKFELPFIQEATKICKENGIISHYHVCGRSLELVEIVAEESDLDAIEPLEEPPGGNVDLKEIKKRFGKRLGLKGNINTTDFLMNATPEQVEDKCKRAIDDAATGGGFILSTGDQVGRDTPDENLFKMIEVAKTYGKYI
jgi:uroporphyrinogen-III decarboxylase